MKTLIPLILLLSLSLTHAEEMLSLLRTRVDGQQYKYEYPVSKVKKLPEWDMKGETPISFDKAVKKAWQQAQKQYPDVKLFLEEVELDPRGYPVSAPAKDKKICWVYRFEFVSLNVRKDLHKIIILMDGTILEPRKVAPKGVSCVLNVKNVQAAVKAFQTLNGLKEGDPLTLKQLVEGGLIDKIPTCPQGHEYTSLGKVPSEGGAYLKCSEDSHKPNNDITK